MVVIVISAAAAFSSPPPLSVVQMAAMASMSVASLCVSSTSLHSASILLGSAMCVCVYSTEAGCQGMQSQYIYIFARLFEFVCVCVCISAMEVINLEDDDERGDKRRKRRGGGCMPSLFDVFAGIWVFLYERAVPRAQREAQQGFLLDELHSSTARLRTRRDELHTRIKESAVDAKKVHAARGDVRGLRSRLMGIRRLKTQVERIEGSLLTIETNIDEIVNSDVTREIIDSLRRSTEVRCFSPKRVFPLTSTRMHPNSNLCAMYMCVCA